VPAAGSPELYRPLLKAHGAFANTALQERPYGVTPKVWSCRRWLEKDQADKESFPGLTFTLLAWGNLVPY